MKKIKEIVSGLLTILLIAGLGFGGGYWYCSQKLKGGAEVVENAELGMKLPGETVKRIITVDEIETKLMEIGELSTYAEEYEVTKEADYFRHFLDDIEVLGTKNTVHIECKGIVKVGYTLEDIGVNIDNESGTICIALPEAAVNDNYIIWDTVKCREENNPLHPIAFAQYQTLIDEMEAEGLSLAEEQGIYEKAEEHLKNIILHFLSGMDGYQVKFL